VWFLSAFFFVINFHAYIAGKVSVEPPTGQRDLSKS